MQLLFTAVFSNELLQAVCRTLIHSIWQGLIAALLAALIVTLTKRSAAAVRYNLLLTVFILFIVGISITTVLQLQFKTHGRDMAVVDYPAMQSYLPAGDNANNSSAAGSTQENLMEQLNGWCNEYASTIVMIWFFLFLVKCIQLITGLRYVRQLRRYNNCEASAYWKERLQQLAQTTGVKRTIVFLQSELIKVPAVIGFLKPVLLVPAGLLSQLPPEQVEAILLHELAHIRRRDFLINLLQSFVETIFFFNPAIVWISSLIREEREACCDDIVVANIPQKASYLQALVSFQELSFHSKTGAMALTGHQHYLLNRVRRMLTLENKKLNLMEKTVLLLSIIGITAFGFITKEIEENAVPAVVIKSEVPQAVERKMNAVIPVRLTRQPEAKKKKTVTPSISKAVADTVPKPNQQNSGRSFPSISSNTNSEGSNLVSQIEATDNEGKHYKIKRVNGQITELFVNGTAVPQNQYGDYNEVIRQIDETQRQQILKRKEIAQLKKADAVKRKEILEKKMAERKEDQEKRVEKMKLRNEIARTNNLKRAEDRKLLFQKNELKKIEFKQKREDVLQKEKFINQKKAEMIQKQKLLNQNKVLALQKQKLLKPVRKGNDDVSRIISDLDNHKLVPDADNLSFSLTNTELIVNGTKQPAEMHKEFKEKYIQNSSDRFNYLRKGNTTSITINKE